MRSRSFTRRKLLLAAGSPLLARPAFESSLRNYFRSGVERNGIAGASLAVWSHGETVFEEQVGQQCVEKHQPVTPKTIFHWASITKTMTGAAILQLRDRGSLRLDDPVLRYVPEINMVRNPHGPNLRITLRHLLSHSAGFRAGTWPWDNRPFVPTAPGAWGQLVATFPETDIQFPPGSRFSYSNLGILFLGRTIERLSGLPFARYIEKHIFEPLGMKSSYFDKTPAELLPYRSASYYRSGATLGGATFDYETGVTMSNSGLNAPLGDMLRYLASLGGHGPGVVAPHSLEEMWRPILPAEEGDSMGLCFFVTQRKGIKMVSHMGDQNAFISRVGLVPSHKTAYAVAYNTTSSGRGQDTKAFDRQLKEYFIDSVFSNLT